VPSLRTLPDRPDSVNPQFARFSRCGVRRLPPFECATAVVPLDYDKPKGKQITVALARLPASDPGRKIGSLFLNPGGPGGSGVDFLLGAGPFLYSDEVRARFDLVGFDPRGIIRSTPLRCYETFDEAIADLAPFPFPVTREEERVKIRSDRALAGACAERGGPILNHMSTANVARDMDLLRRAVGDTKLTYAGYSYGSYLGSTYANLFPGKVRALVVDGALDPVAWSTGRGDQARTLPFSTRLRAAKGAYETLLEFFRLCDDGGPNCAFSEGNPARRFDRLAKRLLREPVEFTDPASGEVILVTYAVLISATLDVLYDPFFWPEWAGILEQLDELTSPAAAAAGLQARQARLGADFQALRARLRPGFQQEDYPNFIEGGPGVFCSETHNPDNARAWSRAGRVQDRRYPTSAGPGPGRPASASPGRAGTGTTTTAPGTAPPPTRCWSSATCSTRRPPTTGRSPSTGCSHGRGCSPWPAGGTPRCSPPPASTPTSAATC
jgi:pimeloyl-ACP methyl ester carboxylesterase